MAKRGGVALVFLGFLTMSGCLSSPKLGPRESQAEARLRELGITLPTPAAPIANYVRAVRSGNLVFLSGHGPSTPGGGFMTGPIRFEADIARGREAARLTAVSLLASLRAEIGNLDRVVRIPQVFGMVNTVSGFTQHSEVMNGCSDLLVSVFGNAGRHTRAAVGMVSLPRDITVEISMVVEVDFVSTMP